MDALRLMTRRNVVRGIAATAASFSFPCPSHAQHAPRIVVIGGGFGGAACARTLRRIDAKLQVTLVEPNKVFTACPFSNEVIAGLREIKAQQFTYDAIAAEGVNVVAKAAVKINPLARTIGLADGTSLIYDRLILAPGIDMKFDALPGYNEASAAKMPHAWKAGAVIVDNAESIRLIVERMILSKQNIIKCQRYLEVIIGAEAMTKKNNLLTVGDQRFNLVCHLCGNLLELCILIQPDVFGNILRNAWHRSARDDHSDRSIGNSINLNARCGASEGWTGRPSCRQGALTIGPGKQSGCCIWINGGRHRLSPILANVYDDDGILSRCTDLDIFKILRIIESEAAAVRRDSDVLDKAWNDQRIFFRIRPKKAGRSYLR